MTTQLISLVPEFQMEKSGVVFYSDPANFHRKCSVYLLGFNPGGNPDTHQVETVQNHLQKVTSGSLRRKSLYESEQWAIYDRGQHPYQKGACFLCERLGLEPAKVPSSNVIFERSISVMKLAKNYVLETAKACWKFHQAVISKVSPKAIICFGNDAAKLVRQFLSANFFEGAYVENNNRMWRSRLWRNNDNLLVYGLSHPSRANWLNPDSDPTPWVARTMKEAWE